MRSFKAIAECAAVATASLMAYVCAAGTEVVQNGDFEDGSATDQAWGSYAGNDGYNSPGWSVTVHGGLAKPNGTWMNNLLDVGRLALFLQSNVDYTSSASQSVVVDEPGTYRISFKWAARPGHAGQNVEVWFDNNKLDTISTTDTSLQYWYKDVEIFAAGSYLLDFEALNASGDVATVIDSVSMRKIDKYMWTGGGQTPRISDAGNWGGTPGRTQLFNSTDYLVFDKAADVEIDSDVMVDGMQITGNGAVTFTGSRTITIERGIISESPADCAFNCPVKFLGTYFAMQNGCGAVKFPGGVTAKYPDATLRTIAGTKLSRTLQGDFTFTEDWTAALCGTDADRPWTVPAGSTVHGQVLSGLQTSHRSFFRLDEGASAYFSCVTNGWDIGDIDIDGYMEVSGDMIVQTYNSSSSNESHFGRRGNIGTLKANRIAKSGHSVAGSYIPNLVVGAGGMGVLVQDYYWRFMVDTTITAAEDFNFLGLQLASNHADWGINFNTRVMLTVNVPEGITVTCGIGVAGEGSLRKTGAGTLVMTDTFNGVSDYIKNYCTLPAMSAGTIVDEGVLQVEAAGQLGSAPVKLAAGTLLKIAPGVSFTNRIVGEGTVQLANGVTLANGGAPWNAAAVEFAAAGDAVTVTAPEGTAAPFTFLTGVDAADLSRFAYAGGALTVKGGALMLADAAAATDYVWNGGANGDWAAAGSWLVGGAAAAAAPGASDTIRFENGEPVTVTGSSALSVTKIVTSTGAEVTFACPVAFAGTYNVLNAATAPNFAGGATATVPDDSLTEANMPSHELKGNINFTANWTIPVQPSGRPFVLTAGSTLTGRILSGVTYDNTNPVLRIDEGAVATFDSVDVAGKLVFFLNGGNLVSIGDITTGGVQTPRDFGYYGQGNVGTVEARGIYKSVTGYGNINIYTTNMVVGAGGFGMYRKDYAFVLCVDAKLTAKDDFTIYQPVAEDGPKDGDWGLNMNGFTFTLDTAGHTVVFDSYVNSNAAVLIKEGEGEMIMQSRQKQHTGGTILNAGLTTVKTSGALGYGTTTVKSGATLAFSADQMLAQAYPIVVNDGGTLVYTVGVAGSSTLTLNAGAILKPTQGAVFSLPEGRLALPGVGSVKIDLRDFSFVDGIANAILGGAAAGDETKFTALVPAGVVGAFSVSDGFLYYTPTSGGSAAADLFWHPVDDAVWSTSIAAWTNAAGSQVAFTPYANATIAAAATISLPEDVPGNDVTIATDGDVTLTGAGTLGGIGNVVKRGSGTLTLDGANFDGQNFTISEGKVVLGDNAGAYSLGTDSGSVGGTVTVQDGAQFNVNTQNTAGNATDERFEISQLKTFVIAGNGPDGRGAIVNDSPTGIVTSWGPALRRVELAEDATIGGANRYDVRARTGTSATSQGGIFGPGKQLTIKCPGFFGLVSLPIDVGSVLVTGGGVFRPESPTSISIPGGITLDDGTLHGYAATYPATVPVFVGEGGGTIDAQSGTTTINAPVLVADGASLKLQGGSTVHYESGITNAGSVTVSAGSHDIKGGAIAGAGEWTLSGGSLAWYQTATLDSPKTLNLSGGTFFYGKETSGLGKLNQKLTVNATGGTFAFNAGAPTTITADDVEISGKPSAIRLYGKNDASMVVRLEGIKATADTIGSSAGGGNANYTFGNGVDFTTTTFLVNQAANCLSSIIRVEEGASLTVGNNLTIGDSAGANEYRMIVDGGRVVCEGTSPLHMAYQANAGYLDFLSGEMEVPGIWCRIGWFSPLTYDEKFTMDGGTLSITGAHATNPAIGGYTRFKPFIQFNNGKIVSLGNWAVQQMLAVSFGDKAGGHVEFDIADKTVDWRTGRGRGGLHTLPGRDHRRMDYREHGSERPLRVVRIPGRPAPEGECCRQHQHRRLQPCRGRVPADRQREVQRGLHLVQRLSIRLQRPYYHAPLQRLRADLQLQHDVAGPVLCRHRRHLDVCRQLRRLAARGGGRTDGVPRHRLAERHEGHDRTHGGLA